LLLSFDGVLQDVSRKRGSSQKIVKTIEKLLSHKDIDLEVCHVFTPETVSHLSKSIQLIMGLGVQNIFLTLSTLQPWGNDSLDQLKEELTLLRVDLISMYKQSGVVRIIGFRRNSERGIFRCSAGKDRMALTPDGKLWGCYLFPDLFKDKENTDEYSQFCFGDIDSFIKDYNNIYPKIIKNYSSLRMDNFSMSEISCRDCPDLFVCTVCPMHAALSGFPIGIIPDWICKIKKIIREEKRILWKELENLNTIHS
jgi:radical SAM protein with 4Fe4S-binding SPASM domain